MEFYRSLIILILERSCGGETQQEILKLLKSGKDLDFKERTMLREVIENLI